MSVPAATATTSGFQSDNIVTIRLMAGPEGGVEVGLAVSDDDLTMRPIITDTDFRGRGILFYGSPSVITVLVATTVTYCVPFTW